MLGPVRRLLFLLVIIGLVVYRERRLTADERANGYGPYAPVKPTDIPT